MIRITFLSKYLTNSILIHTYISVLLFCLASHQLWSQKPYFRHFTSKNGLAHDITYQLYQDSKGYVWIGTDDGLSRFNGSSFKNYSYQNGLKSNYVIDVIEHGSNDYFIATWGGGLHRMTNDSIYKFSDREQLTTKISRVLKANDTIYYTVSNGLITKHNVRDGKEQKLKIVNANQPEIQNTKGSQNLSSINLTYRDGKIYAFNSAISYSHLASLKGLYVLNNNSLTPQFSDVLNDKVVHGIAKNSTNGTYVSSNNVIYYFEEKLLKQSQILNLPHHSVFNLEVLGNLIYFISYNQQNGKQEAYVYNFKNKKLRNLNEELGIHALVSDLLIDCQNNLWISTYGEGIFYIPKTKTKFYADDVFESPNLTDVVVFNNTLYLNSSNNLYAFANGVVNKNITTPFHTENIYVDLQKSILYLITPNELKKTERSFSDLTIKTLNTKKHYFQKGPKSFSLNGNRVEFFDGEKLVKSTIPLNSDSYVRNALLHKNKVYVIYDRLGVFVFDFLSGKLLEKWNKKNGYQTDKFYDILIYKDKICLASDRGIMIIDKNKRNYFTKNDGLLSNHVNDLFVDHHGVLWAGTQKGLNVMHTNRFFTIDESKGQQSSSINRIIEFNEHIFVTGNNGLFQHDNVSAFKPSSNSRLLVTQNNYQFNIDVINFSSPKSLETQYRINNNEWQIISDKYLDFSTLRQGDYTVVFRTKDASSNWLYSDYYTFQIAVEWYEQPIVFMIGTGLFFLVIIYVAYRRIKLSEKRNKFLQQTLVDKDNLQNELRNVRHQIAQDFHDDLGNKLASISITSNLLLKDKSRINEKAVNQIQQINIDSNILYNGMRDFVWSLDHNHNKVGELQIYLSDFGEQLFKNTDVVFKSAYSVFDEGFELPSYWNKQLVLLFKEALTNCYKHSGASEVLFTLELRKSGLTLQVSDNGSGFIESELKNINGIKNMRKRATSINGTLTFQKSKGTTVTFTGELDLSDKI